MRICRRQNCKEITQKEKITMKKFSNAIWSAVLAAIVFCCYFFVPKLHLDGLVYAGCILIGGFVAYMQDALTSKERKKRLSNALWCAVFAVIVFACYFLISALHFDGMIYAGCILIGAFAAYMQDALTKEKA